MDESKVRAAARVASELATNTPDGSYNAVWNGVFSQMLYEPHAGERLVVIEQAIAKFIDDHGEQMRREFVEELQQIIGVEVK